MQSIAEEIDKTANAVSKVLHRVRIALMQCIQKRLAGEGGAA